MLQVFKIMIRSRQAVLAATLHGISFDLENSLACRVSFGKVTVQQQTFEIPKCQKFNAAPLSSLSNDF